MMRLEADPLTPGLWHNKDWDGSTPGTFAVVIGISRYDHLDGSQGCYGLNQLAVSAYTAYSFFRWLRDEYRCRGVRLAKCWLLLAPNAAELPLIDSDLAGRYASPTMQNCEDAIGAWYGGMRELPPAAAEQSRSFLFFSGHGLEVTPDKQILLPQDYLKPPAYNVNRALSTQNLAYGLRALKVPLHFFFVDACRNDHNDLGGVDAVEGTRVLNVFRSSLNNPNCYVPLFYASASGTQAWQPSDPARGTSVYGQALIEGLRAEAGLQPVCSPEPCVVNLPLLKTFVNTRVAQILQGYQASVTQLIRLSGELTDEPVAEVDVQHGSEATLPTPAALGAPEFAAHRMFADWPPANLSAAQELFESASLAHIWFTSARVCSLPQVDPAQPAWLPGALRLDSLEWDAARRVCRVELSISGHSGGLHWLQFEDQTGRAYGCVLPGDAAHSPRYSIEIELDTAVHPDLPQPIVRLAARLALDNAEPLDAVAALWQTYEYFTAQEAAESPVLDYLESQARNPLAASASALVLARVRQWERLAVWLRDAARQPDAAPDSAVLWLELLSRYSPQDLFAAGATDDLPGTPGGSETQPGVPVLSYLLQLAERGLPWTGEGLACAGRQVDQFLEYGELAPTQRTQLDHLQASLRRALRRFRSGGLFCCFAGAAEEIGPVLVQADLTGR